jgi:hypothetical protein
VTTALQFLHIILDLTLFWCTRKMLQKSLAQDNHQIIGTTRLQGSTILTAELPSLLGERGSGAALNGGGLGSAGPRGRSGHLLHPRRQPAGPLLHRGVHGGRQGQPAPGQGGHQALHSRKFPHEILFKRYPCRRGPRGLSGLTSPWKGRKPGSTLS